MPPFNIKELTGLLEPYMEQSAWPGLGENEVRERARDYARKTGLWDEIGAKIGARNRDEVSLAIMRRSQWRDFSRTGERARGEAVLRIALSRSETWALAVWLEHPDLDIDEWQDQLWAWCETTWWKLPAHESRHIDLMSSRIACQMAEWKWTAGHRLEREVSERISHEIAVRALDRAHDPRFHDEWQTNHNNWNLVCNANLIGAALYEISDARRLAAFVHPLVGRLQYAIDGFTDDGGCVEGPSYWEYGFGHFLDVAVMLGHRTGGAIDLTRSEKLGRIARFPFASMLRAPHRAPLGDAGHGFVGSEIALKINRFWDLPAIFELVAPTDHGEMTLSSPRALALWKGEKPRPHLNRSDAWLPDLGFAKAHASQAILAVTAGRNDVSHNHNDVGSFVYAWNEALVLTDPGLPVYNAQTFGSRRYEMLVCRSMGHSVPLVNGFEQQSGAEFFGVLAPAETGNGAKTLVADLSRAYCDPTLQSLKRHFTLQSDGALQIRDEFDFTCAPQSLEEAFVTWEDVEIVSAQRAHIGVDENRFEFLSETAGRFSLQLFSPEEHQGQDKRTLRRLIWVPDVLAAHLELSFRLSHNGSRQG